ncbi:hypothetical protein PVAND_011972 [Polypedilum vanderplanki]|uniref:Uncharacterized protein n=1 Tax=Polypedilum vanderplanki TaxID=319348 RepID=A0A9J6CK68_POLVA|nr:hypothetical protein PVAND_011972 [Polypedilum vanderplanki]
MFLNDDANDVKGEKNIANVGGKKEYKECLTRSKSPTAKVQHNTISRIPIRTANAEKRAREMGLLEDIDETNLSPSQLRALRAEKRAAWRQARLKSLEQDAIQAQIMIQSLNSEIANKPRDKLDGVEEEESNDDLITKTTTKSRLKFPRIAIKLRPGQVTVREKETILDEKVIQRTEEVPDPVSGEPTIQTFEYVEKVIEREVETCQEKIFSLELEDPKSLESPSTPSTESFSITESIIVEQQPHDDSDDNQSMITVCPNNTDDTFVLNPTDPDDYINANVIETSTQIKTIVEVINPMLTGDGTATEIAVGRPDDLESFNQEVGDDFDGVTFRRELSLNDKMKNVLKELKENEKVRLSLSRSMEEDEDENENVENVPESSENDEAVSTSYEEKQGSIGTVFMVRERLINDFYDHQQVPEHATDEIQASIDSCQVISNPSVDEFLANEIRHSQDTMTARKETLTLDLTKTTETTLQDDDDDEEDETTTENTPTTPTKMLPGSNASSGGKKKRRKSKGKAKK